jgi:hypothetical protein
VNLSDYTCFCARWQDTRVPCGHAVTVIYVANKAPVDFMPAYMSHENGIAANAAPMQPISLDSVEELCHVEDKTKAKVAALLLVGGAGWGGLEFRRTVGDRRWC